MRQTLGQLLRRATVGALALTALWAPCGSTAVAATAAPFAPAPEAEALPFGERYRALQHGNIVRAGRTVGRMPTAEATASPARAARVTSRIRTAS